MNSSNIIPTFKFDISTTMVDLKYIPTMTILAPALKCSDTVGIISSKKRRKTEGEGIFQKR